VEIWKQGRKRAYFVKGWKQGETRQKTGGNKRRQVENMRKQREQGRKQGETREDKLRTCILFE
jgi:hypothetical protein